MARSLQSLLRLLLAPSARKITVKRLVEPRENGDCVATCDANGLLVTKEEAAILVEAGAVDRRGDHGRPTRQLKRRRRDYVSRDLRA